MLEPSYLSEYRHEQQKAKMEAEKLRKGQKWKSSDKLLELKAKHNAKHNHYSHRAERLRGAVFAASKCIVSTFCNAWENGKLHHGKYLEISSAMIGSYIEQSPKNAKRHVDRLITWGFIKRKYTRAEALERFGITTHNQNYLLELNPVIVRSMIGDKSDKKAEAKAHAVQKMQALAARGDAQALNAFVEELLADSENSKSAEDQPGAP